MSSMENTASNPPYLFITSEGSIPTTYPLEINNSLFAGSGSNCQINLQGEGVCPIHCMFWINEDSVLRVQDWNTDGQTLVNHQSVTAETVLNAGDRVTISQFEITPILTLEDHKMVSRTMMAFNVSNARDEQPAEQPQAIDSQTTSLDSEVEPESAWEEPVEHPASADAFADTVSPVDIEEETPMTEDDSQDGSLPDWDSELPNDDWSKATGLDALPGLNDPMDSDSKDEEIELLKMEIEQLRFELSERENETSFDEGPVHNDNPVDDDQTLQLVNRLEELLEELKVSDERVRDLEELLQYSDEAARAEKEERQQLESWVTEIEQRVSQREAESEAELNRVLSQLEEAQAQRQHVEMHFKKMLQSNDSNVTEASKEVIQRSRAQIEELQKKLAEANQQVEQLGEKASHEDVEVKAKEELLEMEQKLMKMQVETSQERAEMARQRADLENLKDELESKLAAAKNGDNADSRFQAMRQHLRDIHEEEKQAQEEKRQKSLSGRISRLLTRVGR